MEQVTIIDFISNNWQFIFLYIFKILKDRGEQMESMKKILIDVQIEMAVLKNENKTRNRRSTDDAEVKNH